MGKLQQPWKGNRLSNAKWESLNPLKTFQRKRKSLRKIGCE